MPSHVQIHTKKDGKVHTYQLHLPLAMGRVVPEEATFEAEFVEEGILFRYVGSTPRRRGGFKAKNVEPPSWAKS